MTADFWYGNRGSQKEVASCFQALKEKNCQHEFYTWENFVEEWKVNNDIFQTEEN